MSEKPNGDPSTGQLSTREGSSSERLAPVQVGAEIELTIERLASGGSGVGRYQQFVIFVPFTAPDERVRARINRVHKSFATAELTEILIPSPHRRQPQCPVFGRCGGCQFQHVEYAEQVKQKSIWLRHELAKTLNLTDVIWEAIAPSPVESRYRNRIQLHFDGKSLGFFARGSHQVVDADDCWITDERITREWPELRAMLSGDPAKSTGQAPAASRTINSSKGHGSPPIRKIELGIGMDGQVERSYDKLHGEELGFSQINSAMNAILVDYVIALGASAEDPPPASAPLVATGAAHQSHSTTEIWDLYCGKGNFTIPLARRWPRARLIGVEANSRAIAQARTNVQEILLASPASSRATAEASALLREKADNRALPIKIEFVCSDVEKFLRSRPQIHDLVMIIDPPRAGCQKGVVQEILRHRPRRLVYVSCDPATFRRDAGYLVASGLKLKRVKPFDLFPQTDHVELVAEFMGC